MNNSQSIIFDTHVHYNLEPLFSNNQQKLVESEVSKPVEEWQDQWQKAQQEGVKKSIVVGTNLASSAAATSIAEADPNLFAAIGIHPHDYNHQPSQDEVESDLKTDQAELKLILGESVVAIGETGLDYFRLKADNQLARQAQQQAFTMQLKLANQHNLPAIVHVRDQQTPEQPTPNNAYWDSLDILAQHLDSDQNFILHCVSGPINYIKQALKMGAHIGVAANVTYKKADRIREIVKLTPADRLLLETDAPFLPPQQYRGQVCQPWMISLTGQYLEKQLGVNLKQVWQNSHQAFNLN